MNKSSGQIIYDAYFDYCRGKSLVSGAELPLWKDQDSEIQAAWEYAANALVWELKEPREGRIKG